MKKTTIKFIVIIFTSVLIFLTVLTGFSFYEKTVDVTLLKNGETAFSKSYKIAYLTNLKLIFKYRNNYSKMYENEYLGNFKLFLETLNSDMYNDLYKYFNKLVSAPKDAVAVYEGNGIFKYEKEVFGSKVNAEKTLLNLIENNFSPCFLFIERLNPSIKIEDLKSATVKITTFETSYATSSPSRKHNVELAAKKLDGITVLPMQTLSFNESVGKRTKENGYETAKVIENGIYVDGVGGGVCQVSGTLMNAWLRANLSVPYSRNHSLPSSYLKPGFDATVSESIDLLLKNDSDFPIYIDSYYDGNILRFTLYGKHSGYEVNLSSELVREIPCNDYEIILGTEDTIISPPVSGKIYKTKLILKQHGKVVEERYFRTSTYLPIKGKKIITKTDNSNSNGTQ